MPNWFIEVCIVISILYVIFSIGKDVLSEIAIRKGLSVADAKNIANTINYLKGNKEHEDDSNATMPEMREPENREN